MTKSKNDYEIKAGDPLWPYHGAHKDVCRILGKIYEGYNPLQIFESFVDICHIALDSLPHLLQHAVRHEPLADAPEIAAVWQAATTKFRPETIERMSEALAVLLQATELPDGSLSYADVIGSVYMEFLPGGKWRPHAQFFTPWSVASCMAQMTMGTCEIEQEFQTRLAAACEADPALKAMALACAMTAPVESLADTAKEWFWTRLLPAAMPKVEPIRVLDPCVGSGVMLLAAAKATPRWLIDIGFVQFFGIDIDPLVVKTCRLNMRLYGIEPVLKGADMLTLAEAAALPWPHDRLYGGLIEAQQASDQSKVELYKEGINLARVQQLEMWEGLPMITERPVAAKDKPKRHPKQTTTVGRQPLLIALAETVADEA
jgi:hypothetical protein